MVILIRKRRIFFGSDKGDGVFFFWVRREAKAVRCVCLGLSNIRVCGCLVGLNTQEIRGVAFGPGFGSVMCVDRVTYFFGLLSWL